MATWRRKRKRQPYSAIEYAWNIYQDEQEQAQMAAGGGATTAYKCKVEADKLVTVSTTCLRTECARVADAQEQLSRGETVIVAGSDMQQLRGRLASFGVA